MGQSPTNSAPRSLILPIAADIYSEYHKKGGGKALNITNIPAAAYNSVSNAENAQAVSEKTTVRLSGGQIDRAVKTGRADTLILSDEAKKKLDSLGKAVKEKNELSQGIYQMKKDLENSQKSAKAMADDASHKLKMLEIARRIQNGDRVPGKDEKALLEYDEKLYQVSKQIGLMKQKEKRKEYDSLLDDEQAPEETAETAPPQTQGIEITGSEGVPVETKDISEVTLE